MENSSFTSTLISWYQEHKRDLPWRDTRDPYKIWLSEIILQQTRVAQGTPYYFSFLETYPTVQDLAQASEQEVLRLWQGLGYYSRARNLHKCAKTIVDKYHGGFPSSYQELVKLPGIGDYTASAIASFAFQQPTPAVDGNVFRVLSRIFGVAEDITKQKTRKVFRDLSYSLISQTSPDTYNQALMEFGAIQCTPLAPKCNTCPFQSECVAFQTGKQQEFPVKSKRVKVRNRYFYYLVLKSDAGLLMKPRESKDIWQGLYDFFLIEPSKKSDPYHLLSDYLPQGANLEQLRIEDPTAPYLHKLTHQHIHATFIPIELRDQAMVKLCKEKLFLEEFDLSEIPQLPKPILIDNYLKADIF